MLTGRRVAELRKAAGISQQELAFRSEVNKAYISEYETGVRPQLPSEMLERIELKLLAAATPAGHTRPSIDYSGPHPRLVLMDQQGNRHKPRIATVQWTEVDGTSYSLFVGERTDS